MMLILAFSILYGLWFSLNMTPHFWLCDVKCIAPISLFIVSLHLFITHSFLPVSPSVRHLTCHPISCGINVKLHSIGLNVLHAARYSVSMLSLSLSIHPFLSHSSPGAMIKVAGMSLCSTAVITEEKPARKGRWEEGEKREWSGVQTATHRPHLVWRYVKRKRKKDFLIVRTRWPRRSAGGHKSLCVGTTNVSRGKSCWLFLFAGQGFFLRLTSVWL